MKLIVGLGNPGPEYASTPHNAGFLAVDRIAEICATPISNRLFAKRAARTLTARTRLAGHDVLLAKPETYMNLSGLAVAALLDEFDLGVESLIVLYDELAIPLGTIRIRERGSAAGHNGVRSISAELETEEWTRIRIGIGRPPSETGGIVKSGGKEFLLTPMRKQMLKELDESLDQAVRAVEAVLTKGVHAAMNEFNRKVNPSDER